MKRIKQLIFLLILLAGSCSKDASTNPDDGQNNSESFPEDLTGTLYYNWATEGILKVDFPSGVGSAFIPDDTKLNGFDVSRDGKYRLSAVNASSVGNSNVRFTLSNLPNGSIVCFRSLK